MFKVIQSFPNYMINDKGIVLNKKFEIIKQRLSRTHRKGYMMVELYNEGKKTKRSVHSLVMEVFIFKRPFNMQINHIDGDTTNNDIANLEYVTASENIKHAYKNGLMCNKGEGCPTSKLTDKDVREIKMAIKNNVTGVMLSKKYNISQSVISAIKTGRTWSHINV